MQEPQVSILTRFLGELVLMKSLGMLPTSSESVPRLGRSSSLGRPTQETSQRKLPLGKLANLLKVTAPTRLSNTRNPVCPQTSCLLSLPTRTSLLLSLTPASTNGSSLVELLRYVIRSAERDSTFTQQTTRGKTSQRYFSKLGRCRRTRS